MKVTIQKRIEVEDIPDQVLEKAHDILESLQDEVFISLKHFCNQVNKNRGNLEVVVTQRHDLETTRETLQDLIDNFEDLSNFMKGYEQVLTQLETPPLTPTSAPSPDLHPGLVEKVAELQRQQEELEEIVEEGENK